MLPHAYFTSDLLGNTFVIQLRSNLVFSLKRFDSSVFLSRYTNVHNGFIGLRTPLEELHWTNFEIVFKVIKRGVR